MNQFFTELARSLVPARTEVIFGAAAGVTGMLASFLFGEWNNALRALGMFIFLDYVTGLMAAYIQAELSSQKGLRGIVKKLALIFFIVFAHWLDLAIGQSVFCLLATYAMLGNEGLSIVENLSRCGVPVPVVIKEKLEQLTRQKKALEMKEDK